MNQRIRQAIEAAGVSLAEASRSTGVSYPTLMQYLSGKRSPAAHQLAALCSGTGINANYILNGIGNPLLNTNQDTAMPNEIRTLRQSKVDAEAALDAARTLTKEARQALAAAQREEKHALGRFEAARLAWIEAAEAHYGAAE
jgi:transcriptional regulator with XRE-family HTH domain